MDVFKKALIEAAASDKKKS